MLVWPAVDLGVGKPEARTRLQLSPMPEEDRKRLRLFFVLAKVSRGSDLREQLNLSSQLRYRAHSGAPLLPHVWKRGFLVHRGRSRLCWHCGWEFCRSVVSGSRSGGFLRIQASMDRVSRTHKAIRAQFADGFSAKSLDAASGARGSIPQ